MPNVVAPLSFLSISIIILGHQRRNFSDRILRWYVLELLLDRKWNKTLSLTKFTIQAARKNSLCIVSNAALKITANLTNGTKEKLSYSRLVIFLQGYSA